MKITKTKDALHAQKPEGIDIRYYLFRDYEIHYNEQAPGAIQAWHHHEHIWETIYIIEGGLIARWREDGQEKSQTVRAGDVIETERTPHTFANQSNQTVRFLVVKHMPSGKDYRDILKNDKVLD